MLVQSNLDRYDDNSVCSRASVGEGRFMKYREYVLSVLLIVMSVAGFITFAGVATERPLTALESVGLQFYSAFTGFLGTYIFGRQSAKKIAAELNKPHAKSAFRRLLSMYRSLSRMASIIDSSRGSEMSESAKLVLARLEEIATAQISTADDALADWTDIVPEDVEELHQVLSSTKSQGGR